MKIGTRVKRKITKCRIPDKRIGTIIDIFVIGEKGETKAKIKWDEPTKGSIQFHSSINTKFLEII